MRRSSTAAVVASLPIALAASITSASAVASAPPPRERSDAGRPRSSDAARAADDLAERDHAVLAARLRTVERLVGGAQELGRAGAVVRVGRDPGAQAQREAGVVEPLAELARAGAPSPRRAASASSPGSITTNSSPPMRAAAAPSGQMPAQHEPDLAQERVAELVPGAVVDVLEVVAVEHDEAERLPHLLRPTQLAVEQVLEPAPVEQPGQRVGVGAAALAVERDRRVERRRRMRGEQRSQLALAAVELPREPARADEQADLGAVRPQRDQDDRAQVQAAAARAALVVLASSSSNTADASMRPRSASSAASGTSSCPSPEARHSVVSTSCPSSSRSRSWLVSSGSTRPSERTATSAIARGSRSELM